MIARNESIAVSVFTLVLRSGRSDPNRIGIRVRIAAQQLHLTGELVGRNGEIMQKPGFFRKYGIKTFNFCKKPGFFAVDRYSLTPKNSRVPAILKISGTIAQSELRSPTIYMTIVSSEPYRLQL
ncbi:hypothetical protein QUA40_04310 [Microcoleus sp. Pol11C3]|uniref:hypothetical protein n=1 Tax=Microcoleus sp. Pol11C3 TaxID=3055390 RepID=UPI002FD69B71